MSELMEKIKIYIKKRNYENKIVIANKYRVDN